MIARREAGTVVAASAVVFLVLAWLWVPWEWVPGGELRPARVEDVFAVEEVALAEEYSSRRRLLGWAAYFLSSVVALLLGLTRSGAALVGRLRGGLPWWGVVPVATLVLLLLGRLVTLPLSVSIHRHNLAYGITEQAWGAWLVDHAKSLGVAWVLTAVVLVGLLALVRRSPRRWFYWAGGGAAGLAVAASFLYPVLLEPVFNEFTPMPEGPFEESVLELAEEQGVRVDDVLVSDASRRTTTLNAYVSGLGTTRRVVVFDNLLEDLTPDEARAVIAHELAHAANHDVALGTSLGAAGAVGGVALLGLALGSPRLLRRSGAPTPSDPTVVPLVLALATVGSFLASPVESGISRAIEVRADREALVATGDAGTFVAMQRELALASLSDPTPPAWSRFWFGSHPTVLQRAGLPGSMRDAGLLDHGAGE